MKRSNSFVLTILLLYILCGESYAQWQRTNLPDSVRVNTIKIRDSFIVAGTDEEGIFVSTDDGENWTSSNNGLQDTIIHTICIWGNRIFAGTETGVSVSTDDGESWRSVSSGLSGLSVWSLEVSVGTAGDTTIFAGAWSGVYSSTDWGEDWKVTRLSSTTAPVHSIVISDRYIYAATFSGGIFLSRDNGLTWWNFDIDPKGITGDPYPIPVFAPIYSISVGPFDYVIAGSIGGLYFGGDTLFKADTSLAKLTKQAEPILCFANRNDTLFTALHGYLYGLSENWVYVGSFRVPMGYNADRLNIPYLGNRSVYSLALNNAYIFAGTEDGIWRLSYPGAITRVESSQEVPAGFVLEQNYPNPFNPTTVISYRLPVVSNVTLLVYDVLGRPIATLVNERRTAGSHLVQFDAGDLPSGVYFYMLQAGSYSATKKLLLLK